MEEREEGDPGGCNSKPPEGSVPEPSKSIQGLVRPSVRTHIQQVDLNYDKV